MIFIMQLLIPFSVLDSSYQIIEIYFELQVNQTYVLKWFHSPALNSFAVVYGLCHDTATSLALFNSHVPV